MKKNTKGQLKISYRTQFPKQTTQELVVICYSPLLRAFPGNFWWLATAGEGCLLEAFASIS